MDFDMKQHEVVFNCTKRALERALFSYTLSANEVYDAALIYTGDEKNVNRNASTAGFKNIYARTLMKTMNCFCVNPCKNLSFEVLASGPKIYDNIYQENRWHQPVFAHQNGQERPCYNGSAGKNLRRSGLYRGRYYGSFAGGLSPFYKTHIIR